MSSCMKASSPRPLTVDGAAGAGAGDGPAAETESVIRVLLPPGELDDRELVHLDRLEAAALLLVLAPRPIAEALEHTQAAVCEADLGGRTLLRGLPLLVRTPARLGAGLQARHPIPVPFECGHRRRRGELVAVARCCTNQFGVGLGEGAARGVPFLL